MGTHPLAFLGLVAVLVVVPGPAVVLIMKNAVLRGRGPAVLTAVGVLTADLVWMLTSAAGVTAVLVSYQPAFEALRYAGAAYLAFLGLRLIFSRHDDLLAPGSAPAVPETAGAVASGEVASGRVPVTRRRAFIEGLLCDLSNPKTLLVFTSVIPQFLAPGSGVTTTVLLGLTFAVLGFVSLLLYTVLLGGARATVRRPRFARGLLRTGGAVLVAFGAGLVLEPVE